MNMQEILFHPMSVGAMIGLGIGLALCFMMFVSRWKAGREVRRYRKMLDDKSQMETKHLELYQSDKERLEAENTKLAETNDKLRQKITQMKTSSEVVRACDVEIMARAEKQLLESSPSFAIAWENAKHQAAAEVEAEEAGTRSSESFFQRFMPSRNGRRDVHNGDKVATIDASKN